MAGYKKGHGDTPSLAPNHKHGLYFAPQKYRIFARSPLGRLKKKIVSLLLEGFKGEIPRPVQILADGLAVNIIIVKHFQGFCLSGEAVPTRTLRDYVTLWNAVSRDLTTLQQFAKENGAPDGIPDLQTYLASLEKVNPEGDKE
jgi:hypothetical protein